MKKIIVMLIMILLLITNVSCDSDIKVDNDAQTLKPTEKINPENEELETKIPLIDEIKTPELENESSINNEINSLIGTWNLKSIQVEGDEFNANDEGIKGSLVFYIDENDNYLCDLFESNIFNEFDVGINYTAMGIEFEELEKESVNLFETLGGKSWYATIDSSKYHSENIVSESYSAYITDDNTLYLFYLAETKNEPFNISNVRVYVNESNSIENGIVNIELNADYGSDDYFNENYELKGKKAEIDEKSMGGTVVCINSNVSLSNLRIVEITYAEDKQCFEISNDLSYIGDLSQSETLVLRIAFMGSIPNRGIAFEYNGVEKLYSIEMSGEDGSILINEI